MKEIYLLCHGEKDDLGLLTQAGRAASSALNKTLPEFVSVYSSVSERAKLTAHLISGQEPIIDERAGFYMASSLKSDAINKIASDNGITFLDAVTKYNDSEVLNGVSEKATALNSMIDELFINLPQCWKSAYRFSRLKYQSSNETAGYSINKHRLSLWLCA